MELKAEMEVVNSDAHQLEDDLEDLWATYERLDDLLSIKTQELIDLTNAGS
jgi:predicted  nucleic acid-binding Zn-ribbon protein